MATVIDSLIVQLGLDASNFTNAQAQAVHSLRNFEDQALHTGKAAEATGKKLGEFFTGIRNQAIGLLAAFMGGREAKEFLEYLTKLDATTGRVAMMTGERVEDVSAWQGVFREMGASAEEANAALAGMSAALVQFTKTGEFPGLGTLQRLNVSMFDQQGRLKTATQMWLDLAAAVQGMDPREARSFLEDMPGINQGMVNALLQGADTVRRQLDAMKEITKETRAATEAAQRLQKAWKDVELAIEGVGRVIRYRIADPLINVLNIVKGLVTGKAGPVPGTFEGPTGGRSTVLPPGTHVIEGGPGRRLVEAVMGPVTATEIFGPPPAAEQPSRDQHDEQPSEASPRRPRHRRPAPPPPATENLDMSDVVLPFSATGGTYEGAPNAAELADVQPGAGRGQRGVPVIGPGARVTASTTNITRGGSVRTSSQSTHIENININSQAKDAEGVARDIGPAVTRVLNTANAAMGPR